MTDLEQLRKAIREVVHEELAPLREFVETMRMSAELMDKVDRAKSRPIEIVVDEKSRILGNER